MFFRKYFSMKIFLRKYIQKWVVRRDCGKYLKAFLKYDLFDSVTYKLCPTSNKMYLMSSGGNIRANDT